MLLLLSKLISTAAIVLVLSLIAERAGPKLAGILSGLPLGSAVVLFYIGVEQGPEFGAQAGIAMVLGLSASLVFLMAYWLSSKHLFSTGSLQSIFYTGMTSVLAFCGAALVLSKLPNQPFLWVLITVCICLFSILLFRRIPNTKIRKKVEFSGRVLLIRAAVSTVIVLIITGSAELLGSFKIGLFSGFPITLFPLLLIIHHAYSPHNVWTIIKNFPIGMGSLIIYGISVSIFYPAKGVVIGTLVSFCLSVFYIAIISINLNRR